MDDLEKSEEQKWVANGQIRQCSCNCNAKQSMEKSWDTEGHVSFNDGSKGWWQRRTRLRNWLVVGVALLLLVLVAVVIALGVLVSKNTSDSAPDVCITEACVVAAARVSSALDQSVDPCDNFYEFACGGWTKKHVIPDDRSSLDQFGVLRDEVEVNLKNLFEDEVKPIDFLSIVHVKDLYASCMNQTLLDELGVEPGVRFLNVLGGWPIINSTWDEKNFDLDSLLIKLRIYNNVPLINMYVTTDIKNTTRRKIYIDQPDFGMPGRNYFLQGRDDKMLQAYEQLVVKIASELGKVPPTLANITQDAKDIVDLEIEIANISIASEKRRDNEALYNIFTIAELDGNYTKINWLRYMQEVMNVSDVEIEINSTEEIVNRSPSYLKKLMALIEKTPKRIMANYLVWRIAKNRASSLTTKFEVFFLDYNKVIYGTASARTRFRTCASYVVSNLGLAAGRMFVDAVFDEDAKQTALEMISDLRMAFKELLKDLDWMDNVTTKVAIEKVDAIIEKIGYPDDILKDEELDKLYGNYSYSRDTYFENVLRNIRQSAVNNLKVLRDKVDRTIWTTAPSTVNAFYSSVKNQILFPAGILQPPFYSNSYPKSMNYGGIGVVIGHEITHGFDDRGRQYDKNGNLKEWWSNEAIEKFKVKAKCMIEQYSNYTVPEADMKINGVNTQGENIADNGGLKQSYRAYRRWVERQGHEEPLLPGFSYNSNQMFFINFAQIWCSNLRRENAINRILSGFHSPGRFRVIGTLQNSVEFSEAFKCSSKSYMNPSHKCYVW